MAISNVFADIGNGIASGAGDVWNALTGAEDRRQAERERQAAAEQRRLAVEGLSGLESPTVDQLTGGRFDEDFMSGLYQLGPSQAGQAQADPAAIAAQREALSRLAQLGAGEVTAEDRARMATSRRDQEQWLRGQQEATMRRAQERGMSGGGQELAALLNAQQGAASRRSLEDMQMQGLASQRALSALQAQGNLAGGMRGQSFTEGFRRGEAVDRFNKNNTQYNRDAYQRNVDRANAQEQRRGGAYQQQYSNQAQQQRDVANIRTGNAASSDQNANFLKSSGDAKQAGFIGGVVGLGKELLRGDDDDE